MDINIDSLEGENHANQQLKNLLAMPLIDAKFEKNLNLRFHSSTLINLGEY